MTLSQEASGRVVVNVSTILDQACLGRPTYSQPAAAGFFQVYTDILCGGTSTPVPYATSVDLGMVADGDYTVFWTFLAGGYGPVGTNVVRQFSMRNGRLIFSLAETLNGLWWNPDESGWGINLRQRGGVIFAAWFTYDPVGNPKWYVAPQCVVQPDAAGSHCEAVLFEVNGPTFFGTSFNPAAARVVQAGMLRLNFVNLNAGSMTYSVAGQSRTVNISRQPFPPGSTPPPIDYTDMWWNPNESGWGLGLTHQFKVMFLAWYVYDAARRPIWYVVPNCGVTASGNGCSGSVYRTTGPEFAAVFDPAQVRAFAVGTASLAFSDANSGTLSYTVDGVNGAKAITRQVF